MTGCEWEDRLQSDSHCVEWDVKPFYTYSLLYANVASVVAELLEIPVDGNVSRFKVEQVQQLLQQLRVPAGTLTEWSRLKVDGRAFAEMTDSQLAKYNVAIPLVMYFRDRSRLDVLTRL